ncbi:hypothetical protein IAS59_000817 [Cryptococcus gattii]
MDNAMTGDGEKDKIREASESSQNGGNASETTQQRRRIVRGKSGCITCRLRKKRCDEAKPICATCSRLGIECMGYGVKRPKWLREKDNAQKAKEYIKATVMKRSMAKGQDTSPEHEDIHMYNEDVNMLGSANTKADGMWASGNMVGTGMTDTYTRWPLGSAADYLLAIKLAPSSPVPPLDPRSSADSTMSSVDSLSFPFYDAGSDPWISPPASATNMAVVNENGFASTIEDNEEDLGDLWASLFGQTFPASWGNVPSQHHPSLTPSPTQSTQTSPFFALPSPLADLALTPPPPPAQRNPKDLIYLNHYLKVVLPMQYRIMGISVLMGDFVAPLALYHPEVLASVSSLAALHLVSQRTKHRNRIFPTDPSINSPSIMTTGSGAFRVGSASLTEIGDDEAIVATAAHQRSIERLRFLSPQELTSGDVIISVLFAISYHLFSGGTSKHLKEMLTISQRCLSAALASSPELSEDGFRTNPSPARHTPWKKYRHLIEHMIWTDVFASVSQNKASRLLSVYRRILTHSPADTPETAESMILMDKVMGCDSTTLLAYAEIVALSEWRERVERMGCLSLKELLRRGTAIEKLLDERAWREAHLELPSILPINKEGPGHDLRRIMSDVFYGAAKVLLASVINGPFPRVPDITGSVQDTLEALSRLDTEHHDSGHEIHRALVLPITIAGCHCETPAQQAFFRNCFERLGPEAKAFGNTGPALELMEEVWRRRSKAEPCTKICMRDTMKEMGWEVELLLI